MFESKERQVVVYAFETSRTSGGVDRAQANWKHSSAVNNFGRGNEMTDPQFENV